MKRYLAQDSEWQNTLLDIVPDEVWMFAIARPHLSLADIAQCRHVCRDWRLLLGPTFLEGFIQGRDYWYRMTTFRQSKRLSSKKSLDRLHVVVRALQKRLQDRKTFRHPLNLSFPCYETCRLSVSLARFFELQIDAIEVPQGKWYERLGEVQGSVNGCPHGGCARCEGYDDDDDSYTRNSDQPKLWTYEQAATVYRPVRLLFSAPFQKPCPSLLEPVDKVWLRWKEWDK